MRLSPIPNAVGIPCNIEIRFNSVFRTLPCVTFFPDLAAHGRRCAVISLGSALCCPRTFDLLVASVCAVLRLSFGHFGFDCPARQNAGSWSSGRIAALLPFSALNFLHTVFNFRLIQTPGGKFKTVVLRSGETKNRHSARRKV